MPRLSEQKENMSSHCRQGVAFSASELVDRVEAGGRWVALLFLSTPEQKCIGWPE
jgi:hypothetical protein